MPLDPRREFKVTASMAPTICCGTSAQIFQLWEEAIGAKPPRDFSNDLAVHLGTILGPHIIDWLERTQHLELTERERFVEHPTLPWLSCTLDAFAEAEQTVYESKFLSPFWPPEQFTPHYAPQVEIQMACRQVKRGNLAVLRGTGPIALYEMRANEDYLQEVVSRLELFKACVESFTPPQPLDEIVPPERWRTIDLNTLAPAELPNWAGAMQSALDTWADTKRAADTHATSKEDVKALLPNDVGTVKHDNIIVKRDRRNAITIREIT